MRALGNSYFLKEDGLFFSFPIQGSGLSLFSNLSAGEFCPLPVSGGISPTDTFRKDSALRLGRARRGPPVTSEKSTLFIGVTKIVSFCKALHILYLTPIQKLSDNTSLDKAFHDFLKAVEFFICATFHI
jgi:hypothetical protein